MEKLKNILKYLLLAFVFISIGFSIGKEAAKRSLSEKSTNTDTEDKLTEGEKVVVYYMYSTFRCPACNEIERLTQETVENDFHEKFADGSLLLKKVNFQKDERTAKRYKIAAGCVVVAKIANGKDLDFKVLEDVWTLYDKPAKFKEYLGSAISAYLQNNKGEVK